MPNNKKIKSLKVDPIVDPIVDNKKDSVENSSQNLRRESFLSTPDISGFKVITLNNTNGRGVGARGFEILKRINKNENFEFSSIKLEDSGSFTSQIKKAGFGLSIGSDKNNTRFVLAIGIANIHHASTYLRVGREGMLSLIEAIRKDQPEGTSESAKDWLVIKPLLLKADLEKEFSKEDISDFLKSVFKSIEK